MRRVGWAVLGVALLGWATGCSSYNDKRGRGDAPVGRQDRSPAVIIEFPDKFANVAFKCHAGDGIYVTTRDAAPVVVPHDPACSTGG